MMAQQVKPNDSKLQKKCGKCGHVSVCSIFRAVGPLLQNWTDDTRPLDPEDLAMICDEFIPASTLSILKGDSTLGK